MAKKTKRISVKEREKMKKDPQWKKIYNKCQKNCEKEKCVFSIAYKQYLALLFKSKKCDDKCLLKFEKKTLKPATQKFLKCYQEKVDPCVYKAFEKKSKKTLKKTLKKKTKKTLKKKEDFWNGGCTKCLKWKKSENVNGENHSPNPILHI